MTVGGLLTLSGGTLSGLATAGAPSGTGTTAASGGITLNPAGGDFTLDGDTLTNPAGQTAAFAGLESGLLEGDGAEFVNDGTLLAQAVGKVSETGSTGNAVSFINNGTFTRSVNTSLLNFDNVAFNVNAPGTVDVLTGILNLTGGGTSTGGAVTVESGATLYFGGSAPFTLDSATTLSGTGTVTEDGTSTLTILGNSPSFRGPTDLDEGYILVDGSQPASTVNLVSGALGGSGTVGPITSSGTVGDGPGILTAQGNMTLASTNVTTISNVDISINGANPGTGFTQLVVNGTTLASSVNLSTFGQAVTFTATVTPDARSTDPPTGTVTFEEGTSVLGTAPLNDGVAAFAISTLAVSSDTVTSVDSGDANFATARGVTTETVNAPTTPAPATSTGPRLTGVQRFGFHAMPTTVVLASDQPLDPGSAEDVRNYVIVDPSGHRIRINRAVLDPTRLTVALHPAQQISIHHPYKFIVNGAGPGAVSNMSGEPLDSVDAGQPGSSDHVVLTWRQLVLGGVVRCMMSRSSPAR
jgi:hypothetical protein